MLKDRKFWTGMILGTALTGSVALLQPLSAAPPAAPSETEYLKAIAGALVKIRDNGTAMQKDLAEIKSSAVSIDKSMTEFAKGQNVGTK